MLSYFLLSSSPLVPTAFSFFVCFLFCVARRGSRNAKWWYGSPKCLSFHIVLLFIIFCYFLLFFARYNSGLCESLKMFASYLPFARLVNYSSRHLLSRIRLTVLNRVRRNFNVYILLRQMKKFWISVAHCLTLEFTFLLWQLDKLTSSNAFWNEKIK